MNIKLIPTIYKKCRFEINKFATDKINETITKVIEDYGYNYEDYVTIKTSSSGNVIAIYTNARQITFIYNEIVKRINMKLESKEFQHVSISLGSLTGLMWLSARGPHIPIKLSSKGIVNAEILSSLTESGINQTLHKIHIRVSIDIVGFLPFHSEHVNCKSDCMLSESLIVGQVPDHYTKVVSGKNNDIANEAYKYSE